MSIHETIPQQPHEPEQQPIFSAQETIKHFSDAVFDGNVPTYNGYRAAYQLSNEIYQEGDVYYHESGEKLDAGTAEEFIHCASPDRWALKSDEHAKYFRVSRATSIDSLKSTDRRNAEFRLQDPSATDEMILRDAKADADKRITLSSQIYEQYGKDQPMTSRTKRVMANEALGITPETRKAEEIANAQKKAQRSFVAQHAPAVVKFMRTKDRKAAVEDTDFPISPEDLAKVGISRYEVLEDMALSFMLEKIEQATNRAEKTAAPGTPWGEQTSKQPNQPESVVKKPVYNAADIPVPPPKHKATIDTVEETAVRETTDDPDDAPTETLTSKPVAQARRSPKPAPKLVATARRTTAKTSIVPADPTRKTGTKRRTNPDSMYMPQFDEETEQAPRRTRIAKVVGRAIATKSMLLLERTGQYTDKAAKAAKDITVKTYDKAGNKILVSQYLEKEEAEPAASSTERINAERRALRIRAARKAGMYLVAATAAYVGIKSGTNIFEHGDQAANIDPSNPIYGSDLMNSGR